MAARALAIVHQPDAGPGVFGDALRNAGVVLDEWIFPEVADPPAEPMGYDAVLSFGGAMHADQEDEHPWLRDEKRLLAELLAAEKPLFGVCLGAQILAEAAGAPARRAANPEIGWYEVDVSEEGAKDPVLGPLAPSFEAFGWHSYECDLPDGAVALARSETCLQAFRLGTNTYGIQFHAEVSSADAESWIEGYDTDPDAIRVGIDPSKLWGESAPKLEPWNKQGQALATRWLTTI